MGITNKFEHEPKLHIACIGGSRRPSKLLLCFNSDYKYQFVDIDEGRIHALMFDHVKEAEDWLEIFGRKPEEKK